MPATKLFPEQMAQIIKLYEAGNSQAEIARQFEIDQTRVSAIVRAAGVSRGKGRDPLTITTTAQAPISPDVLSWQAVAADISVDADVRLLALTKLKQFEAQAQATPIQDDDVDPFGCSACRKLGSWRCTHTSACTGTKGISPALTATAWAPDAEAASVIAWAEGLEEG